MRKLEEWEKMLAEAIEQLRVASKKLEEPTYPQTPRVRPRVFRLVGEYTWSAADFDIIQRGERWQWLGPQAAGKLLEVCGYQPRKVLRLLRRIQAATAWCKARRKGRERMAQEILRQQQKALEALEAEHAMRQLAQ